MTIAIASSECSILERWKVGDLVALPGWRTPVTTPPSPYPGGSKSRVTRAGEAVRKESASMEDLAVITLWRAAHRPVLNTFQAILRIRARDQGVVVAQRHKRRATIFDKLHRFPRMELARMDDIAGCRLIFKSTAELYAFRHKIHEATFKHRRKNETDKYDYIKSPKPTGYRGIHDVYEYDVQSEVGRDYKGLFIELQYRTTIQHAWATAVEVIGFVTTSQPKFQQGDKRYEEIMTYASEILARAFEDSPSCLPELSDKEIVKKFLDLDKDLKFMKLLRGLHVANKDVSAKRNIILMFREGMQLEVRSFRDATDALRDLFSLEASNPGADIVLVKGDTSHDVRVAFKNYFSDATDFIRLVEEGCQKLTGHEFINGKRAKRRGRPSGATPK
jgi:putative GTP pyrophosphokinase